jgi:hypothetical protein
VLKKSKSKPMKTNLDVNCIDQLKNTKSKKKKKIEITVTDTVTVTVTITSAEAPRDSRRRTLSRPLIPLDKVKEEEEEEEETVLSFS